MLAYIAPLLTLLYALTFLVGQLVLFLYAWRTRNWAATEGIILHSEIKRGPVQAHLNHVTYVAGVSALRYPSVIYRYTVAGTQYHASELGYRGGWSAYGGTLPWKAADKVQVRYNPAHPSEAVLQGGIGPGNWLGILLGVVAVALTAYWLSFLLRAA